MASGYHDTLGACFMTIGTSPAGGTVTFTPTVATGVTAEVIVDGERQTLVDGEPVTLVVPASDLGLNIDFEFAGEGDILGSLVFNALESNNGAINDVDLLKFSADIGVRSVGGDYPIYGETADALAAVSGFYNEDGTLILGTG